MAILDEVPGQQLPTTYRHKTKIVKKPYQVKPATESSLQTLIIKRQVAITLDLINILFNSYYTITSPIL